MDGQYVIGDIVLGNWKLIRLIGEGSFGRVYEAEREDFGRTYKAALKIITIPQNKSEISSIKADGMDQENVKAYFKSFVEDLVNEFSLMAQLKGNSNVVSYEDHTVIEHSQDIGWDIIIRMELLTPLLDLVSEMKMTKKDVMKLGADMCQALELCQKFNIVHRDVKPENIFVSRNGDFKLGDFGIARTVEKTMGGLSKKGTYTYMAPEVYKGDSYGTSVDIYSLGIVLYRLLNDNRTPFLPKYPAPITHNDREQALARRIGGSAIPAPLNADGRLSEIVLKACAYNPAMRYSSPMQMRDELEAITYGTAEAKVIYPAGDKVPYKQNEYPERQPPVNIPNVMQGRAGKNAAGMYDDGATVGIKGNTRDLTEIINNQPKSNSSGISREAQRSDMGRKEQQPPYQRAYGGSIPTPQASTKRKNQTPLITVAVIIAMVVIGVSLIVIFTNRSKTSGNENANNGNDIMDTENQRASQTSSQDEDDTLEVTDRSKQNNSNDHGDDEQPIIRMPELYGMHYTDVPELFENYDVYVILVFFEGEIDETLDSGVVVGTEPNPGDILSNGDRVVITYNGREPMTELVPNLVGSKRESLEIALSDYDSMITLNYLFFDDESEEGTILYIQNAGHFITVPATIDVHLSSGAADSDTPESDDPLTDDPTDNPTDVTTITIGGREYSTSLTTLDLSNRNLTNSDIEPLRHMTNLTSLDLSWNPISDLQPISGLTRLTSLNLYRLIDSQNNRLSDITPLRNLTNLTFLNIGHNSIGDLSPLSGMTNMRNLRAFGNGYRDISALSNMINMVEMDLSSNYISDVNALSRMTSLTQLTIFGNQISNISSLSGLTSLTKLYFGDDNLSQGNNIQDISPLSGLINLTELNLDSNQVSDLSALRGLANLVTLYLHKNQINDINPLGGLVNLTSLDLSSNQITDVTALSGLVNLGTLRLGANSISDISALSSLIGLGHVEIYLNPVRDIRPLKVLANLRYVVFSADGYAEGRAIADEMNEALPECHFSFYPW